MSRIRVRCADCGSVVFDEPGAIMPFCINRLKPGPGACERNRAVEHDNMQVARAEEPRVRSRAFQRAQDSAPRIGRTDMPLFDADLQAGVERFTPFEGYLSAAMFSFSVAYLDMPDSDR